MGIEKALRDVKNKKTQAVRRALKDAHYFGAKRLERGAGYKYAHDYKDHYVEQEYMPLKTVYYEPTEQGAEREIKARLQKRQQISQ